MNSESTAPADHLQRSAAQQNGLWSPPPTAALVAREARAVDWTARVDSPHGRAEIRPSTASFLQLHPSSDAHSLGLLAGRRYRAPRPGGPGYAVKPYRILRYAKSTDGVKFPMTEPFHGKVGIFTPL